MEDISSELNVNDQAIISISLFVISIAGLFKINWITQQFYLIRVNKLIKKLYRILFGTNSERVRYVRLPLVHVRLANMDSSNILDRRTECNCAFRQSSVHSFSLVSLFLGFTNRSMKNTFPRAAQYLSRSGDASNYCGWRSSSMSLRCSSASLLSTSDFSQVPQIIPTFKIFIYFVFV